MTKKDFELIASQVHLYVKNDINDKKWGRKADRTGANIANDFALLLSQVNPKFDRNRFLAACGVEV